MAYNYFPMNYPYYGYPQTGYPAQYSQGMAPEAQMQMNAATPGANQNRAQTGIIWVQGEAGAKAYPVAPGTTAQLWDSESQKIFLKSADASGMPSMKVLDYTIRESAAQAPVISKSAEADMSKYITREEFEKRISELMRRISDEQ